MQGHSSHQCTKPFPKDYKIKDKKLDSAVKPDKLLHKP